MSRYLLAFLLFSLLFLSTHAELHRSAAARRHSSRLTASNLTHTATATSASSPSPLSSPSPVSADAPPAVSSRAALLSSPVSSDASSVASSSSLNSTTPISPHHFRTLQQYDANVFYLERLCASAPWSPRIKPGLLFQYRAITYKQHFSGIEVSTGAPWLAMFEGSITQEDPPGSNTFYNENDVWASADGGNTWDLITGISRYGRSGYTPSALPNSSFFARGGSNNCEDPASDYIFSLGGTSRLGGVDLGTNQVWYSSDGKIWQQQESSLSFNPTRYSASCDLDASGHIYTMGGINKDQNNPQSGQLVNDVWSSSIVGPLRAWRRVTAAADWPRRAEHLVVIGESPVLQKEIIYVLGGWTRLDENLDGTASNDIWASSDGGVTWSLVLSNAPWAPRWGHSGFITAAGVLLIFGGSNSESGAYSETYTHDDVWTSFDGGNNWSRCNLPDDGDESRSFVRHKAGVALTEDEEMVIASGITYPRGAGPAGEIRYQDVWKTPFKLSDTRDLAIRCNANIPARGIGLRFWPRNTKPADTVFAMTAQTRRAPWSARASPALLVMQKPITYRQVVGNVLVSTPPNWLLLYEGSLIASDGSTSTSENDVWASGDEGQTWNIISGISFNGSRGYQPSTHPYSSFVHRRFSNNCEDPSNDDVYSIGGLFGQGFTALSSNEVWYSSDSITWSRRSGQSTSFAPTRYASSCDIDGNHNMFVAGGRQYDSVTTLLNDVWMGTNLGRNWLQQTDRAPFKPRSDHLTIIHDNRAFGKTLIYVIGGQISADDGDIQTANDVWVSSDQGVTWAAVNPAAPFQSRRGLTGVITDSGVMVVVGGTYTATGRINDQQALRDMWLSLDGGYTWTSCNLPSDHGFIRGQQGATLTLDERLMLASGYAWEIGAPRTDYVDLWISNISIANAGKMAQVCGEIGVPSAGTGLRIWPGTVIPVTNPTLSLLAISAIVSLSIVVFSILLFCYWSYRRTGRLPVPSFLQLGSGGGSTQPRRQPVGNGDYFQPSGGGSVGGGSGFGTTTTSSRGRSSSGAMSGGSVKGVADVFSSFESGGDGDYHPPTGGYVPPGANGRDEHSHSMLS